jgi:RND superfamily putative drug exporter
MLARLGELVFRRAKLVLVLTGVAVVAAAVLGVGAFGVLKNGGFDDPGAASIRAANTISAK